MPNFEIYDQDAPNTQDLPTVHTLGGNAGPDASMQDTDVVMPLAPQRGSEGQPTGPRYEAEESNNTSETEKKTRNLWKVAVAVGAIAIVTAVAVRGCSDDGSSNTKNTPTDTIVEGKSGPQTESCPEGIFSKEKPYAAASDVKPGHLMRNPDTQLKNKDQAYSYLMGNKEANIEGELCALPSSVATFETIFNGWVGEGSAQARPFGSFTQDANELNAFYAAHPKDAEKTLDKEVFKSFVDSFELNDKAIKGGAYFKIALLGNKIVQEEVQLGELKAGSVFQLEGNVWYSDSKFTGTQLAIMDRDGNVFVRQSIGGVPIIAPTPETTTTTATSTPPNLPPMTIDIPNNGGGNGGGNGGSNGGGNGGGNGGSNGGGNGGGNGGNNGGGNGGGNGGSNGGGNGGGNGGSNGGGNGGNETPTTIYNPPTTVRPPVTTMPPRPTTTTTQPKGPEVTIPGAPN
jgi:hypothetical protein